MLYIVNVSGALANSTLTNCYSNGTPIGNVGIIPVLANNVLYLQKATTDQLWASANAALLATPIAKQPD
jgi:hypothetical protein